MTTYFSERRCLLKLGLAAFASSGFSMLAGCGVDPVTGQKQLMMVSKEQEISIDHQQSPFQFSSDYGLSTDAALQSYVGEVGRKLLPHVHRPDMPYTFQVVNANYVNAYAFPGGSIGITRGILLKLENEAQLASLIGHELGHVNARHSAEQMSKGQLSSILVAGVSMAAGAAGSGYGDLAQKLGMLGQSALLSKYSRNNEHEADGLGNAYMIKAGYPSRGFVMLMEMLDTLHKGNESAVQVLFSTHPMSRDRLSAAVQREKGIYASSADRSLQAERYKDHTAALRARKKGIEALQEGERLMAGKAYGKAEAQFAAALKQMDDDYCAHVLMAKCLLVQDKPQPALSHATHARRLDSGEAQGHYITAMAYADLKQWDAAYQSFAECDRVLPGNPQMLFFKGYTLDKQGNRSPAAAHYKNYLTAVNYQSSSYSRYALQRLKAWGVVK